MKFTHGSSREIDGNEFDVFDYIIDNNGKPSLECIDNGNDGEGIGVYAFIGDSDESKKGASCYTSKESAFLYIIDVDIEESDLMNYREPDELSVEDLSDAVEDFIKEFREKNDYDKKEYDIVINNCCSNFENITLLEVNNFLKNSGVKLELDEYADPNDFLNFEDWIEQVEEQYIMNDPCGHIYNEGGPESIVENAIDKADNLWETIKYIGHSVAVIMTQKGTERHNKSFQKAIINKFPDDKLVAAYVDDNNFAVIFDTDKIVLEEKININLKNKLKKSSLKI
jgi:hypothetical protein